MKKRCAAILMMILLCSCFASSTADRKAVVKDKYYLGAMRVVRCREYVTLREAPYKTANELEEVPLGAIVYKCSTNEKEFAYSPYKKQVHQYVKCEYEGQEGYIMKMYLDPAPEFEPPETKAESRIMTKEEIADGANIVLNWQEFNVSVLGSHMYETVDGQNWETIRVGCFIDDEPIWGYTESVELNDQLNKLKVFMGGTEDEPQVYVYDAAYGLMMLDLMDGTESWLVSSAACPLGDAGVYAIEQNTGILYIAGTDGPDPVAISSDGIVLWTSKIDDPDVYGCQSITLRPNGIEVTYESGKTVKLEYNGDLISIANTRTDEK